MKYEFTQQYVIGFHGAQGSGKDTLAEGVQHNVLFADTLPLAETLKDAAAYLFAGLQHEHLHGSQAEKAETVQPYDMSGREILQKLGDFTFTIDPTAFSRSLALETQARKQTQLVPDFRRPSEFDYDYGCPKIIIGLTRNMHQVPTHHTDTLMFNKCTHVIHNANMTKEETLSDAIEFLSLRGAILEL